MIFGCSLEAKIPFDYHLIYTRINTQGNKMEFGCNLKGQKFRWISDEIWTKHYVSRRTLYIKHGSNRRDYIWIPSELLDVTCLFLSTGWGFLRCLKFVHFPPSAIDKNLIYEKMSSLIYENSLNIIVIDFLKLHVCEIFWKSLASEISNTCNRTVLCKNILL